MQDVTNRTRQRVELEAREASIALRELEAIAVLAREHQAQLTDEHADGLARVRLVLRLLQLELFDGKRRLPP